MPTVDGPRAVPLASLQNTREVRAPAQSRLGEGLVAAGAAGLEITNKLRDAQIDAEVHAADLDTAMDIDKIKRGLEQDSDWQTYEARYADQAQQAIEKRAETLTSPAARRLWTQRADARAADGLIAVRDLARRKGVEAARGDFLTLLGKAKAVQDDETASNDLRAQSVETVRSAATRLTQSGILAADDAASYLSALETHALAKDQERSDLALAQNEEDRIWAEAGGDYQRAMDEARQIANPTIRDKVEDRLSARFSRERAAKTEREQDASDQGWAIIAKGGGLDDIPDALKASIPGATLESMRQHVAAMANDGPATVPDRKAYTDLRLLAASDPGAFVAKDLQPYRARIGEAKFTELREQQEKIKRGDEAAGATSASVSSAMSLAKRSLEAAGYDLKANASDNAKAKVDDFQADLIARIDAFVEKNRRQPNASEQRAMVDDLLTPLGWRNSFFGVGLGPQVRITDVFTPYDQIPRADQEAIAAAIARAGKPVTRDLVEETYAQAQARKMGLAK